MTSIVEEIVYLTMSMKLSKTTTGILIFAVFASIVLIKALVLLLVIEVLLEYSLTSMVSHI